MVTRPKRVSVGQYAVQAHGQTVILRRCGTSGFRIVMRPGALSPLFRRLRDAACVAMEAASPWPFTVEKKPDLALDLPPHLDRRQTQQVSQ